MSDDGIWLDEGETPDDDIQIDEYDLTSAPNDFNILTIFSFIESGAVKIPGFQRNYVWDTKRASKLIESLIIGLPVPQVFLYEEGRNSFLVIDGQQRLMTLYYFIKQRFPRRDKRAQIRRIFDEHGRIPDDDLHDDALFENFSLRLPDVADNTPNKFNRLNYSTLGDYRTQFELRTIRNVIVKQVRPSGDDSSIYEMFNRLNTGGINLTPQEIRSSLNHSPFYDELFRINMDPRWRRLLDQAEPDLHMRDIEVLLRGIALWKNGDDAYAPSMVKFLNNFSKSAQGYDEATVEKLAAEVGRCLDAMSAVSPDVFKTRQGRFSLPLFDAVFPAVAQVAQRTPSFRLEDHQVTRVAGDQEFQSFSQDQTTNTVNVKGRLRVGRAAIAAARS